MNAKAISFMLFGVLLLALTGCDGLLTTEVTNEIAEPGNAETSGVLHGYVGFEGLEGEASTEGYEGWSRLYSLEDGFTSAMPSPSNPSSKPEYVPIRIVKERDTASPELFQRLVGSQHILLASIAILRDTPDGQLEYYRYDLETVYVTEYQFGETDDHDGTPTEVVELGFIKVTITYTPIENDGSPGTPVTASWDFRSNTP